LDDPIANGIFIRFGASNRPIVQSGVLTKFSSSLIPSISLRVFCSCLGISSLFSVRNLRIFTSKLARLPVELCCSSAFQLWALSPSLCSLPTDSYYILPSCRHFRAYRTHIGPLHSLLSGFFGPVIAASKTALSMLLTSSMAPSFDLLQMSLV